MKIWGYKFPSTRFQMVKKLTKRIHKEFPLLVAFNVLGATLIFYCYLNGFLHKVIAADSTGFMMYTIFFVATISISLGLYRSWFFSSQIKRLQQGQPSFLTIKKDSIDLKGALESKISSLLNYIHVSPQILTGLGLLGTVAGLVIMLSSMGGGVIGDAAAAKGAMSIILGGFALAIYTTLVGLFFAIWTQIQNSVVYTQADRLLAMTLNQTDISK